MLDRSHSTICSPQNSVREMPADAVALLSRASVRASERAPIFFPEAAAMPLRLETP
jgi:hypothetical protein